MTDFAAIVDIDFGVELLEEFLEKPGGVLLFNRWIQDMLDSNILYPCGSSRQFPLMAGIEFIDACLGNRDLRGLDLGLLLCDNVNYDDSDLSLANPDDPASHSTLGAVRNCSFKRAILEGCHFVCDISGCDFSGYHGEAVFEKDCWYDPKHSPRGLPDEILRQIHREPSEEPEQHHARTIPVIGRMMLVTG